MAPDITLFPIQQTMPSPLISVIVPIYNMESLLPRCLDSLAAQTLRDLEIICVDDGSTDGSGGIVRKYASGDSRFRLITQENSGRAEARNAGIRAAAAPYLGFADPDDYVEPDMYERLYRLAEESGADMVQCSYSPFLPAESGESRGMAEEKLLHIENTACDGVFTEKGEIFRLFLEDRITGVVWSKLFRRLLPGCSAPLEVRLPSSFTSGEDTLYVSRAIARCRSVALTSEKLYHYGLGGPQSVSSRNRKAETRPASYYAVFEMLTREKLREGVLGSNRTAYMNYIVPLLFPDNEMPAGRLSRQKENVPAEVFQKRNRHAPNPRIHSLFCKEAPPIIPVTAVFPVFIYSYQQHDHLLPGNDRMLVIGSSALAKNHGHLKSSRLAADTLIFNFPLNHPCLWRQMEHSLSGTRYSIILFMWPPLHLSPANGRLMEKPPEGGGPMESAEDMLCRLFAFLRKQTRRLILLSSPPSDYGSARHPYAEEPGVLEAWNALLRTLAGKLNLPFIDFCGDMLQCRPLPGSGEKDFPEAYRNLGKQVLRRLPFGQTWVRRRSGKIHRLLEKRRKRRKERMLARWRTLAAPPHYREETDWITAIHSEKGQARILLIGGSVMRHLWRPLASELQEDIDLFSSTLIPGDPDYLPTLAGYFPSAGYEAVIVSFGPHVTNKVSAISVDDFRKNYMAFVSQLSKRCRFLILATSTSIMDGPDGTLNEEKEKIITAFNAIVREAASSLPGAVLSDHHDFMQGAQYIDPFHFSPPDRAYQAGKTAGLLLPLLSARQEPPKEQECPKTRPEP